MAAVRAEMPQRSSVGRMVVIRPTIALSGTEVRAPASWKPSAARLGGGVRRKESAGCRSCQGWPWYLTWQTPAIVRGLVALGLWSGARSIEDIGICATVAGPTTVLLPMRWRRTRCVPTLIDLSGLSLVRTGVSVVGEKPNGYPCWRFLHIP